MSGVVARWAGGRRDEPVGMLAVVVDTPAGARLVIAECIPGGGWAPSRVVEATAEAVRMVGRQDTPITGDGGGDRLW
jgi:hypothetical protein